MWLGQEGELEQEGVAVVRGGAKARGCGMFTLYLLLASLCRISLKRGGKKLKFVSFYGVLIQHIIM